MAAGPAGGAPRRPSGDHRRPGALRPDGRPPPLHPRWPQPADPGLQWPLGALGPAHPPGPDRPDQWLVAGGAGRGAPGHWLLPRAGGGRQGPAEAGELSRGLCADAAAAGQRPALVGSDRGGPARGRAAHRRQRHPPALRRHQRTGPLGRPEFRRRRHGADLQQPRQPQPAGGLPAADPAPGGGGPAALALAEPEALRAGQPGARRRRPALHLQPRRL